MKIQIRPAVRADVPRILELVHELALFERAPEQVINTEEKMIRQGFGAQPAFICFVAEDSQGIHGMSLCYVRYSTWKGSCLYLEDLIVTEQMRGKGIGKQLFEYTLNYAKENDYQRLQWQVLDWNQPAIEFYKSFQAEFESGWLNAWVDLRK
jgi:GNAT superfamily N-acetyltransferase